jgi:hypothetical protein
MKALRIPTRWMRVSVARPSIDAGSDLARGGDRDLDRVDLREPGAAQYYRHHQRRGRQRFPPHAERYRDILAKNGVKLEILPSDGSLENLERLRDKTFKVDVGFVQGGLATEADTKGAGFAG